MDKNNPPISTVEEIKEQLAAIEHERWADWQRYLHSKLMQRVMKYEDWEHWERQIATPYDQLSEAEKQSDREQVDRYWPIITHLIQEAELRGRIDEGKLWNDKLAKVVEDEYTTGVAQSEPQRWLIEWAKKRQAQLKGGSNATEKD